MSKHYDLIILGGGTAGFAAAHTADQQRAHSLMINDNAVGFAGTCVNVACIPTKHLLYAAELVYRIRKHRYPGLNSSVSIDFRRLIEAKNRLVETLREKDRALLSTMSHVSFAVGTGKFVSKTELLVNGETYTSDRFLIATGSSPSIPNVTGLSDLDYLTNVEALNLRKLPASLIIIGAGPAGAEFAQMFCRFGTNVCVLQRADRIVPREEPELSALLARCLSNDGVEIYQSVRVTGAEEKGREKKITAVVQGAERAFSAEHVLVTAGRHPNTGGLGLDNLGVTLGSGGEIVTDGRMRATENVWAAGDVTGEPMLESVAAKQGWVAATNALASVRTSVKMDYRVVPHAVFTDPQLAGVGITEREALESGIRVNSAIVPLGRMAKAQITNDARGAIKVVAEEGSQRILGVHLLAPQAADLLHEGVMIVKNGMTAEDVIDTLHVFPTLSDAFKIAARYLESGLNKT
ncbi:MAG: mercury(II) reductase [Halobacteriota archaeon]